MLHEKIARICSGVSERGGVALFFCVCILTNRHLIILVQNCNCVTRISNINKECRIEGSFDFNGDWPYDTQNSLKRRRGGLPHHVNKGARL